MINESEKQLFRMDVRWVGPDINRRVTAHQLKEALGANLSQSDMKILELRYIVTKSNDIAKFEQNIKNKAPPHQDNAYNRIDANDIIREVFNEVRKLVKANQDNPNADQFLQDQEMTKKDQALINWIDEALKEVMSIYTNDKFQTPETNQILMQEAEPNLEKVRVTMIVLAHPNTFQKCKNLKIVLRINAQEITLYVDHPKNFKEIEKSEVAKIKVSSPIKVWRIGTFDPDSKLFASYFDPKLLEDKLRKLNQSMVLPSSILRDPGQMIKKFEIFTELFDRICIKTQISISELSSAIRMVDSNRNVIFYLRLKHPPRYSIVQLDTKLAQDKNFIHDWKRVENFPVNRNPKLYEDQLIRLHLFHNSVIEITLGETEHKKSIQFLETILQKYNIPRQNKILTTHSLQRVLDFKGKLKDALDSLKIDKQLKWKIKYYILCLLSKGLLHASHVQKLFTLIEQRSEKYQVFLHIFQQMCSNEKSGFEYIKSTFQKLEGWPESMLNTTTRNTPSTCYVFRVVLTPSGYIYSNKSPQMRNRLLREYANQYEHLIRCNVVDDNGQSIKNSPYITYKVFRGMIGQLDIMNMRYIPLGWSPSQLRKFSLWYIHEFEGFQRSQVLNFLGNFERISPFAKMAARIGQAFSSSWGYKFKVTPNVIQIPDEYDRHGKMYTDGIGKISQDLIDDIALKLKVKSLGVIQVRYKGAKGLLAVDASLPKNTIELRDSMIKYKCPHSASDNNLDILSWNMYKGGYLNRQIIILLRTRGVSDEVFMSLQQHYITDIQQLTYRECTIFKQMIDPEVDQTMYNLQPANKIIKNLCQTGFQLDKQPFFIGILKILKRNGYQKLKEKSNINVKKAARLVGIIDEYRILKDGQVYCRYFDSLSDKPPETVCSNVIIVRNPCLHPGDIRKQYCVSQQQIVRRFRQKGMIDSRGRHPFHRFLNCVIFSMQADRAVTCEISGSDLDGDNFFISWDENFTSIKQAEPYVIVDKKAKPKQDKTYPPIGKEQYDKMLDFFIDYMNYQKLGKIANSHLVRADQDEVNFANSPLCLELAIAHGNAVDFPKSGYCPEISSSLFVNQYPEFMEKDDAKVVPSKSILGELYKDIKQKIENLIEKNEQQTKTVISLDEDLCAVHKSLQFSQAELRDTVRILYRFNQDLKSILFLFELSNEFEVYSGNITSSKGKIMKAAKPIDHIIALKTNYIDQFFNQSELSREEYFKKELKQLDGKCFPEALQKKALMWYVVSYADYFEDLKYSDMAALNQLKTTITKIKLELGIMDEGVKEKNRFMGLVWFTVPKIIMQLKMCSLKSKGEAPKLEVDEYGDEYI